MKRNKLLALSLLACTLLAGCKDEQTLQNGSNPVGNVQAGDVTLDTVLDLQKFYDSLKEVSGGSVAVEKLLEKIAELEYVDSTVEDKVALKSTFSTEEKFSVKDYHVAAFTKEIEEKFEDVVDGKSYLDNDGNFDPEEYKDYLEETYDLEVEASDANPSKYLSEEMNEKLGYNYDEYIEDEIIPGLLKNYIYVDYVTSSSKYKGQFANQYAVKLEVLKIAKDSSKINGEWNTQLIKDVRAVTAKAMNKSSEAITFSTNYSFVTFNSDNDMIIFESAADKLTYNVYENCDAIDTLVNTMYVAEKDASIKQVTLEAAKAVAATLTANAEESWVVDNNTTADQEYYEHIEELLIARALWKIDREVVLARNYDYKTPLYNAMTETEKTEAKGFADTYSGSNTKPFREVAKSNKITAQQATYYSEPEYYNKSTYTSVLPSGLSSLRGTSAKDIQSHLVEGYLLPNQAEYLDPLYLDTSSNTYYICEVTEWYGLYLNENILDSSSKYKSISNYHIEAYQKGELKEYGNKDNYDEVTATHKYAENKAAFESTVELVNVSVNNIITDAMRKEAIVALFEKYGLEVNEQIVFDYLKGQYPDYFEEEE